jgi:alkylated DNA repair protein (DNA oxidative demethylase)
MRHLAGFLSPEEQAALLDDIRSVVRAAPLHLQTLPSTGQPFAVRTSNCGPLGWISDAAGYRYQPNHPVSGRPWPAFPASVLALWGRAAGVAYDPESCLINFYTASGRLGLHIDSTEQARSAPIVSLSLGDTAIFRLGRARRDDPTDRIEIASGDLLVLEGESRNWFHGVERIVPGTSRLLRNGGRINLTLRRVSEPA